MGNLHNAYNDIDKMRGMAYHGLALAASIDNVLSLINTGNDDALDIARASLVDAIDHYYACATDIKHS